MLLPWGLVLLPELLPVLPALPLEEPMPLLSVDEVDELLCFLWCFLVVVWPV